MLEPIFARIQKNIYSVLLQDAISNLNGNRSFVKGDARSLQARPSEFDEIIDAAAQKYDLDPALLKAMVQAESNFSPTAVSVVGAKGLMQLMDGTAQQLGVTNSFDPVDNIEGGARFLQQLLQRYDGNETLALAAYNAGPGAVDRWNGLPPYQETQIYVPRILDLRDQYREWEG
jgi:soluble lytic murein transglycosylase-like protein